MRDGDIQWIKSKFRVWGHLDSPIFSSPNNDNGYGYQGLKIMKNKLIFSLIAGRHKRD